MSLDAISRAVRVLVFCLQSSALQSLSVLKRCVYAQGITLIVQGGTTGFLLQVCQCSKFINISSSVMSISSLHVRTGPRFDRIMTDDERASYQHGQLCFLARQQHRFELVS